MILGVDPGLTGGIALVTLDGNLQWAEDMPVIEHDVSAALLAQKLRSLYIKTAVVERVASMPKQGVATTFKFGKGYGQVLGVLAALEIPVVDPPPGTWKRAMGLSSDKDVSRTRAANLWPKHAERFKLKKNEGRAEAALMALWYLQHAPKTWDPTNEFEADPEAPPTPVLQSTGRRLRRR